VAFGGLGTFGEMERGLVFASIVLADPGLSALAGQGGTGRAHGGGRSCRDRRFRPHVTLARANRQPTGPARDRLAVALGTRLDIPGFEAGELVLYQSTLSPSGARHDPLAYYPLSPFAA
jgi:2'-5' RNA ligase